MPAGAGFFLLAIGILTTVLAAIRLHRIVALKLNRTNLAQTRLIRTLHHLTIHKALVPSIAQQLAPLASLADRSL